MLQKELDTVYPQIINFDGCALSGEFIFLLSKSGNGRFRLCSHQNALRCIVKTWNRIYEQGCDDSSVVLHTKSLKSLL